MTLKLQTQLLESMERLEPLNLDRCQTVGDLVHGMSKCSFGARMLGDVAHTLTEWIREGLTKANRLPVLVYDGPYDTSFFWQLLVRAARCNWFAHICRSRDCKLSAIRGRRLLVVGNFNEWDAETIFVNSDEIIFINRYGRAKPGQVKDGYYPNVVFADETFIIPILFDVLQERLRDKPKPILQCLKGAAKCGVTPARILQGVAVWEKMQRDDKCTVFFTVSGAMTVAQMSLLMCDMIEKPSARKNGSRRVNGVVCSTGALMAHGLIAGTGLYHYKYNPRHSDALLAKIGGNRVTDTIEMEENFTHIDEVMNAVLWKLNGKCHSPITLHAEIGRYLSEHPKYGQVRGILRAAFENILPVVTPAFHDSELGNDHYAHNLLRLKKRWAPLVINQELDTKRLLEIFTSAHTLGIISIGGGYPRNHLQNLAPLTEIINARKAAKLPVKKFTYGWRCDPQLPHHGGMGGCTYEENKSWRKFVEDAFTAELVMDATIAWPFTQKALDERLTA